MANAINWFEIPVDDLDRATRFYEALLGEKLKRETFAGTPMAIFARASAADAIGALTRQEHRRPSGDGSLVYLNAAGKIDGCLERAAGAGGQVLLGKTEVGEAGCIALVRDSEGNTVGLHAPR
ncbi:MAG TPA: VOC family protein [Kofleriaceae bacterium]|nr:VOC family protein [Kofleriaceae bacterium]